ncbi:hypothetical protein NL676_025380 [Syzygium grande]|nr:hypothetical protein NL676_025380 [Syzygium grande]
MVISVPEAYQCYERDNQTGYKSNVFLNLSSFPPYRFSDTRNKLTVLGCDTYALISDQDGTFGSGCISYCSQNVDFANKTACSGLGCCQTSIPKGLKTLNIRLKSFKQYESVRQFNPCGLAFVVDSNSFNISERKLPSYEDINKRTVLALDWMVEWDQPPEEEQHPDVHFHGLVLSPHAQPQDPRSLSKPRLTYKPSLSLGPKRATFITIHASSDNGSGAVPSSAVAVEEVAVEQVKEPEREKEGAGSNGSLSSASGEEAVVVTKFKDSRWVSGTWDLKQFQKDGATDWDAVIDAVFHMIMLSLLFIGRMLGEGSLSPAVEQCSAPTSTRWSRWRR